jgi:hypothetical protein
MQQRIRVCFPRSRGGRWPGLLLLGLILTPTAARPDWLADHLQVHGYFSSEAYLRSRSGDLSEEAKISQLRTRLDVEAELDAYQKDDLSVSLVGVFRPVYDAVYEINQHTWGDHARGGAFDESGNLGAGTAYEASIGNKFPGHGACVKGEFCLGNADIGSMFSGELEPSMIIDNQVFYGIVPAPVRPFGASNSPYPLDRAGGFASGDTYELYLDSPYRETVAEARIAGLLDLVDPALAGFVPPTSQIVSAASAALEASLTPIGKTTSRVNPVTMMPLAGKTSLPLSTPLNYYQGSLGNRSSFNEQAPFDLNRNENRLAWDCFDNAHPWCFVREAYLEVDYKDTMVRVGKQQIVWGKTDAFRLQDNINPVDLGYHNIFPSLEDRRIPQLSLDVIQSFGDVGPLEDFAVEFAWVFDKFRPNQFGQCGEPYAYTIACQGRADAAGHQLFNFALAEVDNIPWKFTNTEPGLRVEFRIPEPSISFSLSAFYGFQDTPVAKFVNPYSTENPNPAALLFLQGIGVGEAIGTVDGLADLSPVFGFLDLGDTSGWTEGFDPYDSAQVKQASDNLLQLWNLMFNTLGPETSVPFNPLSGCAGLSGDALIDCANPLLPLALPWTASEVVLKYPRVWTIGASADYQIPDSDTVLRTEIAYDVQRGINNTSKANGRDKSDVFLAAIGIDRPTYISFLNPDRTAFITFQTFIEHVMDYDDGGYGNGMVVPETQVISTFQMQNYWRNDSIILTNFLAYDWNARAWATGPTLRWIYNNNIFFEIGANFLFGGGNNHRHNIRDLCGDQTLSCLGDPTSWQAGQWQALNAGLERTPRYPWFARQGFADQFMEDRDEYWIGITYQF